jgi:uncharacterized protein YozE (UPF0346 family)
MRVVLDGVPFDPQRIGFIWATQLRYIEADDTFAFNLTLKLMETVSRDEKIAILAELARGAYKAASAPRIDDVYELISSC